MTDDLVKQLRFGVCQDQYDDIEIYETEQLMKRAASRVEQLEAKLALAIEALDAFKSYEQSAFSGLDADKNKRAAYRGMRRKLLATLAKLTGGKP